ncbi:MAG: DUF134 domain-containing protein [Thermoanaerobaculaceae bacterium]|nr:DUF134 domain-containing protein [Thermoanaerobaculaceae bacterium]TAM56823.1 MAG: DUF134 domain-containing protein [Acidobacteriota bacterium]
MARPPNPRRVGLGCETRVFKPAGTPLRELGVVRLDLDGLEALRLADREGLYQEAAAERMGVSRATFGRILAVAHARVAEALLEGMALRIGGGPVVEGVAEALPCPVHGESRRRGRGCRCRNRWGGVEPVDDQSDDGGLGPPAGGHDERQEE